MQHPSPVTALALGVGMTIVTAVAAVLGVPRGVWIAMGAVGVALLFVGVYLWGRDNRPAAAPPPPPPPPPEPEPPAEDEPPVTVHLHGYFARSPLGRLIAQRLEAADHIERERAVSGDSVYMNAVIRWAGETAAALDQANAGELAGAFAQGGVQPPGTVAEWRDYMEGRTRLLRDALDQLG